MTDYRLSKIERLLREKDAGRITRREYERRSLQVIHEVHLSLEDEYTFSSLFGKTKTHGTSSGFMQLVTWKGWLKKVAHHLERYVRENVRFTDQVHARDVEKELQRFRRAIDSATEREPGLVLSLVSLCLVLIGERPDHWNRNHVGHGAHFNLRSARDLSYSQDWNQSALLIFRECRRPAWILELDEAEARRVIDRYHGAVRSQSTAREFVDWFRESYPEAHAHLFLI